MKKAILLLALIMVMPLQFSFSQENENDNDTETVTDQSESIEKHPILTSKIYFNAGLFLPSKSIKIGLNGSSDNDIIDFDDAFGFSEHESTFAGNFVWRFAKKWHLGTEFFGVKNSASKVIEKDIVWEDVTYETGVSVDAKFNLNMYRIFFGRVISTGQKHEFGGGLGVHALNISSSIQGEGHIDDSLASEFERKSFAITAPLPNLGFWFYYTPSVKWAITARADWFGITVGEYSGSLWNIAPGVKYQISEHFGAGLNYRYFKTNLTVDKPNLNASMDLIFQGPLFTLSGNF